MTLKRVAVWIDSESYAYAKTMAQRDDRSVSSYLKRMLNKSLREAWAASPKGRNGAYVSTNVRPEEDSEINDL